MGTETTGALGVARPQIPSLDLPSTAVSSVTAFTGDGAILPEIFKEVKSYCGNRIWRPSCHQWPDATVFLQGGFSVGRWSWAANGVSHVVNDSPPAGMFSTSAIVRNRRVSGPGGVGASVIRIIGESTARPTPVIPRATVSNSAKGTGTGPRARQIHCCQRRLQKWTCTLRKRPFYPGLTACSRRDGRGLQKWMRTW